MKLSLRYLTLCTVLLSASLCNAQNKFTDCALFFLKGNVASVVEKSRPADAEGNINPEGYERVDETSFGVDGRINENCEKGEKLGSRTLRDKKGRLVKFSTDGPMPKDGDVKNGMTFEYDEQGRLASKSELWFLTEEDYGVNCTSYQYDEQGNLVGETIDESSYCANGSDSKVALKVLSTDAKGNWTKMMRTVDYTDREDDSNEIIYYIVTRTINYY